MKKYHKNNLFKLHFKQLSLPIIFFILFFILFLTKYLSKEENCNIQVNYNLNENESILKHNYILFLDKNNKSHGKLVETNGWLLLEAMLENSLTGTMNPDLNNIIISFGKDKLIGWWPEKILTDGKNYFLGKENIKLYYDADDTGWGHRYYEDKISEDVLTNFLSNEPLSYPFNEVCTKINCNRKNIVRVWSSVDWHEDIDAIIISNFITMLNLNSSLAKNVFDTNQQLINFIIQNDNIDNYFKYFEPKVTGYFLLLFYDDLGPKILTEKSRNILFKKFEESYHDLDKQPLISRWGGGEDWFYGCNIVTVNERIPKLMQEYVITHWNI